MTQFTREQCLERLRAQIKGGKPIIGGGAGTGLSRSQMQLARAVIESGTPVVLALFGNPYAAMDLPEPDALLLAYDVTEGFRVTKNS